jgi:AAA family ATP:ADP antiporter
MFQAADLHTDAPNASRLDRTLALFTDVRAGESATALLMLVNILLLLVCYSIIKTVREPLILLGGGAEVRSYAAAGQALVLMGFVPLYGWFASRVDRSKLVIGVSLFFIAGIEVFAAAVGAKLPYVGVAFFVWVGIFSISLVAQFWSFASDIYSTEAGDRLFPFIMIGMTAGAPAGSFLAARLFRSGIAPQPILHIAALLLGASVLIYTVILKREDKRAAAPKPALSAGGGFQLVLRNPYLRLIAILVVLLNVVNTTGEYLIARLLTMHVKELAAINANFNAQAYIGGFSGDYQFWVNVTALLIQSFVTARLVKYRGLRGVLLALPLIALGGYAIVAAGVGFSVVRWIKTAENATDYSIMNTARQLLWLPATREEKYKAKQAIDTFFVRGGDLLSAGVVYIGAKFLHLTVEQFAVGNIVLTLVWLGVALMILNPERGLPRVGFRLRPLARAGAVAAIVLAVAAPVLAQQTREGELASRQAEKATRLHPYEPDALERRLEKVEGALFGSRSLYPFIGSTFPGGGLAVGPDYRGRYGDSGTFNAHAAWSVKSYKAADAALKLPTLAHGRMTVDLRANWLDAPNIAFYGVGAGSRQDDRTGYSLRTTTVGVSTKVQASRLFAVGGGIDSIRTEAGSVAGHTSVIAANPTYRRSRLFAAIDSRSSAAYTRRGGLYRLEWSDYRQTNGGAYNFRQLDAEVQQFVPILRENWVIALRGLASSTSTASGQEVPYFLMPDLGGSHTLRGYSAWRFRDRNRLLLTGEYRWTAGQFVDMALFMDAGTVAARPSDLAVRNFKRSYGAGVSFHTPTRTVTRIELARTHEGTSLLFSFSPSF